MVDQESAAFSGRVFVIRGQRVMLSPHLAEVYELDPQALELAIARNIARFPEGMMFQLSPEEFSDLKSRLESPGQTAPYAFTGQGVAMLSGALFDERAMHESQDTCAPTCSCRK